MSSMRGNHRQTVSISKSSPSLMTASAHSQEKKRSITIQLHKPSAKTQLLHGSLDLYGFKRKIVANIEKGVGAQYYPYLIYEKGTNYTPQALNDPSFPNASGKLLSGLPAVKPLGTGRSQSKIHESPSTSSMHSLMSRYSISKQSRASMAQSMLSAGILSVSNFSWASLIQGNAEDEIEEVEIQPEDRPPSMFRLREDPLPRKTEIKTEFIINLKESETMFLFELPSAATFKESEPGQVISASNAVYDKTVQTGKTKSHTATQTTKVFQKHRELHIPRNSRANSSAFAAVWDIYDSYEEVRRESIKSLLLKQEGQVDHIHEVREEEIYSTEFEYFGQKFDCKFLNSLMFMERFLEKKQFSKQQLNYQGLLLEDPLSTDVRYNYSMTLLWTFESKHTEGRKVISMSWSPQNHNVLAVGYGKFKFDDKCDGQVCIWNVKNPQNPERSFRFESPVTFVAFSDFRSQILAVSFYSGLVLLIDIISRSLMIKASNHNYPLYYPVWQMCWFPVEDSSQGRCLVTCGKNGRVYRYMKSKFFVSRKIMSMGRPHGNIQGVEQPKKCYARKTLCCRHPSAEVLVRHPTDPLMYLVGTSEGSVYFCSVNHRHEHIDVFVAHNGPVYSIQFNPFCSKVFLTCGADWCIRIWAEGIITEPLITLSSGMTAVQDALWDPLRSTVIVSITGTYIDIWDIRRKIVAPKSSTESPTKSFNTVIQFTQNKFNICIGDAGGHVHVMALTEMPFSPNYQEEILAQSIQNALISRPDLLDKLSRLGPPFANKESSYKNKMFRKLNNLYKNI